MIIFAPRKHWSIRDILKSFEDRGRPKGVSKGGYLDDLTTLKKAIILCPGCVGPFVEVAKKYDYYQQKEFPYVIGTCDLCHTHSNSAHLFIHDSNMKGCWIPNGSDRLTKK